MAAIKVDIEIPFILQNLANAIENELGSEFEFRYTPPDMSECYPTTGFSIKRGDNSFDFSAQDLYQGDSELSIDPPLKYELTVLKEETEEFPCNEDVIAELKAFLKST